MSDEELANSLEGWLECQTCVVASHWGCLGPNQKKEVLDDLRGEEGPESKRRTVAIDESASFTCARCKITQECFVCHKVEDEPVLSGSAKSVSEGDKASSENVKSPTETHKSPTTPKPDQVNGEMEVDNETGDVTNEVKVKSPQPMEIDIPDKEKDKETLSSILFRCLRCKQTAHYSHLRNPFVEGEKHPLAEKAFHYQHSSNKRVKDQWWCHQCREWIWAVDIIIAWRPLPADAKEDPRDPGELPRYKDLLPREYLVKWTGRGFRHATWVPHTWLLTAAPQKLRHFLEKGPSLDLITDETLAAKGDEMEQPTIARVLDEDDKVHGSQVHSHHQPGNEWVGHGPPPDVNGFESIPNEWKTVDRVLDVMLFPPKHRLSIKKGRRSRVVSESASETPEPRSASALPSPGLRSPRIDGIQPPPEEMIPIEEWEVKAGRKLGPGDVEDVAPWVTWAFVKWDDLQYDQCEFVSPSRSLSCWDTPPPVDSLAYVPFKRALKNFLAARLVEVPILSTAECKAREVKAARYSEPPDRQPDCVVGGTLMPFQMEGFQWLLYKHFKRESCILADDMGLGKTIQIASLLGYLGTAEHKVYPCLVVVPNSTITNWVREFEKWVPHMRVVPYYGEAASRKVIAQYELYHKGQQGKAAGLKAHVVLTTYDQITTAGFRVFSGIPRWEMLVVDEGQRLKSDTNLIFNRLKTLNSVHRVLLTGTPLNNNLRELFNLLNFLDPLEFKALEELEARFVNLNESLVQELHEMIRPYILRRIKADVLKLPPKVEIIVPISMMQLQKSVYKGILEKNAELIRSLLAAKKKK
ncbi:hypothetical protein TREMEDRAFT_40234, partial [Tremella mesenterica DSM 1558]|uniref:uncharacterized protein n=1 Tax=Tremella mesenterica (strain ATCC 24925 / CBS 8224 / DSM 1558 / NBRC 9311 / NRRL Y-6157 / RJB 2259-6 / UBC 559-6) TaxID=578456 RepID=UPI0003F48C06